MTFTNTATDDLPYEAWMVAMLTLPGMGPNRLSQMLELGDARTMWDRLCAGAIPELERLKADTRELWRSRARQMSVGELWRAMEALGIRVDELGTEGYPDRLVNDIEPPQMLFSIGSPLPIDGPTVAIVGTRKCTAYGQRVAFEIAAGLTSAGVSVVSGLALGIDAAAHRGALSTPAAGDEKVGLARPIGVVASGLDIIYPRQNTRLWGCLLYPSDAADE